ncbi:hypothetical protein MACH24_04860 [Erythrobacter sp. Dej080120_24]|uniref:helix-turn-helix domain-containing protein n=1 Tax=Erythrobacter sp. Dej080120_24 TaxID=3024837 RepID=UPI0029247F5C|nr:hypothetical protein MACH24_04860 [Erythrobacter sp. Dej080120_24]
MAFDKGLLRRKITEAGISQVRLATLINVTPRTVNRWLRGEKPPKVSHIEKLATALHCRPEDFDHRYADGEDEIHVEGRISAASHNAYTTMNFIYGVDQQTIIELAPVLFALVAARAVNLPQEDDLWWAAIVEEGRSRGLDHLQRFPDFQDQEGFSIDQEAAIGDQCFGKRADDDCVASPRNLFVEAMRRIAEEVGLKGSMAQFEPVAAGEVPNARGFNPHVALFNFIAEGDAQIVRKLVMGDIRLFQSFKKAELNANGSFEVKAEIIRKDLADQAADHLSKLEERRNKELIRLSKWRKSYEESFPELAQEYDDLVKAFCKPEGWYPDYYSDLHREADYANPFAETRFIDEDRLPKTSDDSTRSKYWLSFNAPEARRLNELKSHRSRSKAGFREAEL